MYYRRKILLALLQAFDKQLEKISLQKLLFLFSRMQQVRDFDFVPYKYGCYSFQANADLSTLEKYGLVSQREQTWEVITEENFIDRLKNTDKSILNTIKQRYKGKTAAELISITYKQFPYYALKSKVAEQYLSDEELAALEKYVVKSNEPCLFTIGYEGISLEKYLNKLIKNDIKVLCDVRKNALSMKFGFSKNQLKNACEGVGILYFHLPNVGIDSDQRQTLKTQSDYDQLFDKYISDTLPNTLDTQDLIIQFLQTHKRVALTCFEAQSCQCHRSHLATSISQLSHIKYELNHL